MANGNDNHHRLPLGGKVARPQAVTDEGAMTGSFPKYLVLSLRQTDFQTLRAVKIGPLPCGGHASSATGGAVPARPLIPPSVRTGVRQIVKQVQH